MIAAAAPLAAMVGNVPLALIDGNGVGLPVAFLIATLVLLCFSVGYAAMSRRVVNTGAFYTYIARALGKPAGIGSAYVAVVAYAGLTCGLVGAFGYFTRLVLLELGLDIPWYVYSAVAVVDHRIAGLPLGRSVGKSVGHVDDRRVRGADRLRSAGGRRARQATLFRRSRSPAPRCSPGRSGSH